MGVVSYFPPAAAWGGGIGFGVLSVAAIAVACARTSGTLKEITPIPFTLSERMGDADGTSPLGMVTANLGLLPSPIVALQKVGHSISGVCNPNQEDILGAPSGRIEQIVERLIGLEKPIVCCQEVFDTTSRKQMVKRLTQAGYTVLHKGGGGWAPLHSGLLFASRFPIERDGIRFWKFMNPKYDDALCAKGVLRVPLTVPGYETPVILYVTHMQAQIGAEKERTEQLSAITELIKNDAEAHPKSPLFLVGDLNITDTEYQGTNHGEYTRKEALFGNFTDFVARIQTGGTFYRMKDFHESIPVQGCFYDRVLLYKRGKTLEGRATVSTCMDGRLSDHLPVVFSTETSE